LQGIQDWHDDDDDDDDDDEYEDELNTKNKFTLVSAKKLGLVLKVGEISGVTEPTKTHTALGHWTPWMPGPLKTCFPTNLCDLENESNLHIVFGCFWVFLGH